MEKLKNLYNNYIINAIFLVVMNVLTKIIQRNIHFNKDYAKDTTILTKIIQKKTSILTQIIQKKRIC